MKKQSRKDGETLSDPDLELELENDETDNKLVQAIKQTVKRASLVCCENHTPILNDIPKMSESECESEGSEDLTEVEFGPDICKMLNIKPTRSSSFRKQRNSMRIEPSEGFDESPMRLKRALSCPSVPGPVYEGVKQDEMSSIEDFPSCFDETKLSSSGSSHPSQAIEEPNIQAPVQRVPRPRFDIEGISRDFWLPEMQIPRVTSRPYSSNPEQLHVLDELSSNSDSIASWGPSTKDMTFKNTPGNGLLDGSTADQQDINNQISAGTKSGPHAIYRTPPPLKLRCATLVEEKEMALLRGSLSLSRKELEAIGIEKIVQESRQAKILYEKAEHGETVVLDEIQDKPEVACIQKGKLVL